MSNRTDAKFKIGDKVHCFREESEEWAGFDFVGVVISAKDTGIESFSDWEYSVTNAPRLFFGMPILLWESEMEKVDE